MLKIVESDPPYQTIVSSQIEYDYPSGKNHASVLDDEVAEDIIPLIHQAELNRGDLRAVFPAPCSP